MRRDTRSTTLLLPLLLMLWAPPDAVAARQPRAVAVASLAEGPRLDTGSFLFARYAAVNASSLYCGVGFGAGGFFLGIAENPRTGYRVRLAGAMTRVAWRDDRSLTVGLAAADASDGRFAQLYLLPGLSWRALSLSGTVLWSEPLGRAGRSQLDLNPLMLLARLAERVAAGVSYAGSFTAGAPSLHRAGPAVRMAIAAQTVEVEWLARRSGPSELRVAVRTRF